MRPSRTPSRLLLGLLVLWRMLSLRRRRPENPQRILIAHHLYLGDTLMLTPLLARLRREFPAAQIVMTTPKAIAPLYEHRPYGVDALPYDPRDAATLWRLARQGGFDLALVPGDNRFSWVARALGARWIVAFSGDRPAYKSWPVNEYVDYPQQPAAWGDIVANMIKGAAPATYQRTQWPAPRCAPFALPRAPYCVLHVGASSPLKFWPAANWTALAESLEQRGYTVVWSGARHEAKVVRDIDAQSRWHSYAGELDLSQLWHLLSQASLLVCPDTGVAHLGRIVGVPTVTLFGPGSHQVSGGGAFWRDSAFRAVSVDPFICRNQHALFKRELAWVQRCYRSTQECNDNRCMKAIKIEDVVAASEEILKYSAL